MKMLITGACGFVGGSLARFWREHFPGDEVYGFDNFIRPGSESNRLDLKRRGVKIFHGDLRAASDFETLPAVDYVIDAAANPSVLAGVDGRTSSRQLVEHNLLGTLQILEYCKAHRAGLVLLSTSRVYSIPVLSGLPVREWEDAFVPDESKALPPGVGPKGVTEDFSTRPPLSLYGSTKLAAETLALEYGATFDFPVWVDRCGVMAGAGQFGRPDQGIVAFWLHSWKQGRPLKYIGFSGGGHQTRDILHPDDLARLLVKQMNSSDRRPPIVNVSGGQTFSLHRLSAFCTQRWGSRTVGAEPEGRVFDVPWLVLDAACASRAWEWKPAISLEAILEEIARHAETEPDWLDLSSP